MTEDDSSNASDRSGASQAPDNQAVKSSQGPDNQAADQSGEAISEDDGISELMPIEVNLGNAGRYPAMRMVLNHMYGRLGAGDR